MGHPSVDGRDPVEQEEPRIVHRFLYGERVPSWLIDVEPCGPGSTRPAGCFFSCNGRIIELDKCYWVMPDMHDNPNYHGTCIRIIGGDDILAFAPSDFSVVFLQNPLVFVGVTSGLKGDGAIQGLRNL